MSAPSLIALAATIVTAIQKFTFQEFQMNKLIAALVAMMFGIASVSVFAADDMKKEMKKEEKKEMKKDEMKKDEMKKDAKK